jgi:hypothetical protein
MSQSTAYVHKGGDADLGTLTSAAASPTAPTATGVTVAYNGLHARGSYKVTVDFTAFQAAALTTDVTLATLPAKAKLLSVIADTTVAFAGPAGTLALTCGKTAGGAEFLASHDVKTAAVTKGLADADLGGSLNRANAIQGGHTASWSATTPLQCRLTSGTGNLSGLTAGSVTFYITVELP